MRLEERKLFIKRRSQFVSYRTRFSRGFSYIVELRTNGKVMRNYIQTSLDIGTLTIHTKKKTGELPTSLPMSCIWATEWAANGNFAMQIRLPTTSIYGNNGQLSRQPNASKYEKVGSSAGSGVGCPNWLPMGILPGKLVCPLFLYMETVGSSVQNSKYKKVGCSVGSGVGCPWECCHANKAAHNFHIWRQWAAQWTTHYFQV